jgi:hypothetical protein
MVQQLAILVSSHDAYSDLWRPYFAAFHRNSADRPFPVYLRSNFKSFPDPLVKPIQVGGATAWPESMRLALDRISEEFVLLLLRACFINRFGLKSGTYA